LTDTSSDSEECQAVEDGDPCAAAAGLGLDDTEEPADEAHVA
jgi:hypothetical protein